MKYLNKLVGITKRVNKEDVETVCSSCENNTINHTLTILYNEQTFKVSFCKNCYEKIKL